MKKIALIGNKISDDVLFELMNREAALWVCENTLIDEEQIDLLAQLMVLPWKVVLCESSNAKLIEKIEKYGALEDELSLQRGFVHIIASNPNVRQLPERALPVYLLNGRSDSQELSESPNLSGTSAMRRRLNMLERLESSLPKQVVVVGTKVDEVAIQLAELWSTEFRAFLNFVVPETIVSKSITDHFESVADISSVTIVYSELSEFASYALNRCNEIIPDTKISIMVQAPDGEKIEVDITNSELIEQPLLEKFEIIKSKNLFNVSPNNLTKDDINTFFDKTLHSWHAYSAGLPWMPDQSIKRKLFNSIQKVMKEGADENSILYISSEPGAGGTTVARALAFEAAKSGVPTLLAKPQIYEPNATEVASFLYRSLLTINKELANKQKQDQEEQTEIPWLIVFDRDQWDGQEHAIGGFWSEIKRSGRPVVILKVLSNIIPPEFYNIPKTEEICTLSHELSKNDIVSLGNHLNKYLKPFGEAKSESDWIRFWEEHKPDIDTGIAAFWVILEFWLKGLVNFGESIPAWMVSQFKHSSLSDESRIILLEIAALAAERRAIPEQLLPLPKLEKQPLSVLLENIRGDAPGLALVRQNTQNGRFWGMAHDILGRYLINGVYYDRPLLEQLNLIELKNPVELRLYFISRLTSHPALGEARFVDFANQFALKTLKLDERYGNAEFFYYWRQVLEILERFPRAVSETNRAFNHHVAISRRRVAKMEQFDASDEEKRTQLQKAIKQLNFAISNLDDDQDDETNLNLYNSLALAYQDLAALELNLGGISDLVKDLRAKASEATINALKENPNSSYVLETAAKDLLQKGQLDAEDKINSASQALGYIFQATSLENSQVRQHQLNKLATTALSFLRNSEADKEIETMMKRGNPLGYLAKAWIDLTAGMPEISAMHISDFPKESMHSALGTLKEAPRHWILIRIEYDLVSALEPSNFQEQLHLLDELDSIRSFRMSLQLNLERVILLYMVGRYHDGNSMFHTLRKEIKKQNIIVTVPERMRWLLNPNQKERLLCNAQVVESHGGYRSWAQVRELQNAVVPFIPQDFGGQRMASKQRFRCHITFGAMGPFIKAPNVSIS